MATIGFSTARIEHRLKNPKLKDHVCMAILEPESNGYQETLAVLVFFQTMDKGEIMMADCSGSLHVKTLPDMITDFWYLSAFPSYSGKADLTVVRVLRKNIPGLSFRPSQLRNRIFEDVQAANGKSQSPTSRTSAPEADKKSATTLFGGDMRRPSHGDKYRLIISDGNFFMPALIKNKVCYYSKQALAGG